MRIVDEYVDKLYKHANPKYPETKELKEETRTHLNESIKELMMEGYTEKNAFKMAVERFGGFEQAEKIISLMEIRQKNFANVLLKFGVYSLIIVSFIFVFLLYLGNVQDTHFADIGYKVGGSFEKTNSNKIDFLLNEEPLILKASLYDSGPTFNPENPDYTYKGKKIWFPNLLRKDIYYGTDDFSVSFEVLDIRTIGLLLFIIGFTVYYVLFTIWGSIQLYYRDRLKVFWIIVLLLFNVLGYIFFLLKIRWQLRKNGR